MKYVEDGENRKITVSVHEHVLGAEIKITPDRIILSSAMEPQQDASRLSQMLKYLSTKTGSSWKHMLSSDR